jgi:hypothetical protein
LEFLYELGEITADDGDLSERLLVLMVWIGQWQLDARPRSPAMGDASSP